MGRAGRDCRQRHPDGVLSCATEHLSRHSLLPSWTPAKSLRKTISVACYFTGPISETVFLRRKVASEATKRGIRIILDFVVNHSSDQHPWFVDSKSSRTSKHRDWYIWRDGKGPGQPPNNWTSTFGGSAWKFDPATNQFYYHYFYAEQPDLNWRNPAVKNAMFDVTRWWYHRGVSGFRLDAVDTLFEDPNLHDNPIARPGKNAFGDPIEKNESNTKLPEVHEALRGLRKVADENNAVLVGETWTADIAELNKYYGQGNNELQLPMDFLFTTVNKLSPAD